MSGMELMAIAMAGSSLLEGATAYKAADAEQNAARANAQYVRQDTMEQVRQIQSDGRKRVAAATVRAAKGGGVQGSAFDVLAEIEAANEYRAQGALYEGRVEYDNWRARQDDARSSKGLIAANTAFQVGTSMLTAGFGGGGGAPVPDPSKAKIKAKLAAKAGL